MPDPKLNEKLVQLAARVKKTSLTAPEQARLVTEFNAVPRPITERVEKSIAASLQLTENEVHIKLASYDDNDKIIDDINDLLRK